MKRISILKPVFLCWLIAGILIPVVAQVEKGTQNLYETAGKKQTTTISCLLVTKEMYRMDIRKNFWAVTAYDPTTRSLLDAGGNKNKSVGNRTDPVVNADGSVDVYFGPAAPEGKENNWIPTNPKNGFFLLFRFYGPLEGIIDKT